MMNLQGSWVAMPTPFTEDNKIDYQGFETLINRQIKYGTSQLFVLGSAGEVTLLTLEEKKAIVKEVISMAKGKIPVFFSASSLPPRRAWSLHSTARSREQTAWYLPFRPMF